MAVALFGISREDADRFVANDVDGATSLGWVSLANVKTILLFFEPVEADFTIRLLPRLAVDD